VFHERFQQFEGAITFSRRAWYLKQGSTLLNGGLTKKLPSRNMAWESFGRGDQCVDIFPCCHLHYFLGKGELFQRRNHVKVFHMLSKLFMTYKKPTQQVSEVLAT